MTEKPRAKGGCLRLFLRLSLAAVILSVSMPIIMILPLLKIDPPLTSIQAQRIAASLIDLELPGFERDWVSLEEISPNLRRAVIVAEDSRFFAHDGVDLVEMEEAIEDMNEGKRARGASTISMQVIKNLYLWEGVTRYDTVLRKGIEVYLTLWMELLLPKDRILEIYLNIAEWGDGVYGAEAAARRYYDKPASKLSRSQAAHLAAVLPSPIRHSPVDGSRFTARRASRIQGRM